MTTPNIFQVQVSQSPEQFWDGIPGSPDLLLINNSTTDNITVGPKSVQPGAVNGQVIQPLQSISVPGTQAWSAVTAATDIPTMQVNPGGSNYSASALAIAGQIAASGLAVAIAEEIAATGLTLIGAPTLLYNGQITGTAGTPGGWGSTIPAGAPPLYGLSSNDYAGARTAFDNLIGTPSGAAKIFNNPGVYPTTPSAQMQAAINAGLRIYLGYRPAFSPTSSAERTSLLASLAAMTAACTAAGTGASIVGVFLWNEVNASTSGLTPAQYVAAVNFYGPSIVSAGYPLGHVPTCGNTNWAAYFAASLGFTPTISFIGCDYYSTAYNNHIRLDGSGANNINTIAAAYSPQLSVGVLEMGTTAVTGVTPPISVQAAYLSYLQTFLVNRVIAGLTNIDCVWFDGPGTGNCITSATDARIPLLQNFIAGISGVPATGIAAGASAVVDPLAGTPNADYAVASQLSYDIVVGLTTSAGSTIPFGTIRLQWFNQDSGTATPVKTVSWRCPAGTTGTTGTIITGVGPMHAQFLKVTVFNLDTVAMSVTIQLNGTSRTVAKHDWWWDAPTSVAVPTFSLPAGAGFSNSLGSINAVSVPGGGGTVTRLMSMFSGETFFRFNGNSSGKVNVTLNPQPPSEFGSSSLLNETPASEFETILILPRGPCLVTLTNTDAGAHNADIELVGLD